MSSVSPLQSAPQNTYPCLCFCFFFLSFWLNRIRSQLEEPGRGWVDAGLAAVLSAVGLCPGSDARTGPLLYQCAVERVRAEREGGREGGRERES